MAHPAILQEAPLTAFAATPLGMELLESTPALQDAVIRFSTATEDAERAVVGATHIGMGNNSQVWDIAGTAVKVCTPTTGRLAWRQGAGVKPEDMLGQFSFMNALGQHLEGQTDGGITVPDHYFALRTRAGNTLLAQQNMSGWTSLYRWSQDSGYSATEERELYVHTKSRITDGVGSSALRLGLADLGLGRRAKLHAENVLVPKEVTSADDAPLCIIDQPSRGVSGAIAIAIARASRA
jgi:hypothetical protein